MTDLELTKLCAEAMRYQDITHSILARPGIVSIMAMNRK